MAMFPIEPVTLLVKVTVTKATEGGLLGGVTDAEVVSANGKADPRFYGFGNRFGALILNYKAEGRPAKPEPKAPKALTAAQKAQIPGPATKPVKGRAKPAAPAVERDPQAEMFAAFQAFMAAQQK